MAAKQFNGDSPVAASAGVENGLKPEDKVEHAATVLATAVDDVPYHQNRFRR